MKAARDAIPALLGAGHSWRAALGKAIARQPARPSKPLRSVVFDVGSFGSRASGIKSPGAEARGENRLRVNQAIGYPKSSSLVTERSATKKQANLHRGNDKLRRMYTYGERLRWAMAQTDPPTSGRALALRVGIRPQSIHHLLDPARNAKGSRHTNAIAKALGVSADWLSTGTGRPYKSDIPLTDQRDAVAKCLSTARSLVLELERLQRAIDGKG